jgi:hypothetical protein
MTVPKDLRQAVGLRELRYSFLTQDFDKAYKKTIEVIYIIKKLFGKLRRGRGMTLTTDEIRGMIRGWVKEVLREDEEDRVEGRKSWKDEGELDLHLESLS